MGSIHAIKVGDWVEVQYEYAPGTCSDGGIGTVSIISKDEADNVFCSVGHVLDKRIETGIEARRITVTMMPYKDVTSTLRNRREPIVDTEVILPTREVVVPIRSPLQWLEYGLKSRTHEKPGWLKEKLLHYNLMEATSEAMWQRILSDYKCQLSAIEGMRLGMGDSFIDPREHKGNQGGGGKFVSVKKDSQVGIPKNMWTIPYLLHAYDVKRSNFQKKRKSDKDGAWKLTEGYKKRQLWNKGTCVITNKEAAQRKYNARYFFSRTKALNHAYVPEYADASMPNEAIHRTLEWKHYTTRVAFWNATYDDHLAGVSKVVLREDMTEYERMARQHINRQPFIENELIDAILNYNCVSYRQLAVHINNWCQHTCIADWLQSHPTYSLYAKNIKPGLTPENQIKQVAFSRRVMSRWGLEDGTKILWIHCDEKWFHGIVPRTNAKACPELGIKKTSHSAHHKKHIAKVMAHCCVGYLFDGEVENGGDGFLISCDRCASFKMPLRNSYHSSRDPASGKLIFKGNAIKHTKGEPYLVDCSVTGSDVGSATKPCFPLLNLWKYTLVPAIAQLLAPGAPCYGAQVIVQQDNAGPHVEEVYSAWMLAMFEELGWMYEPQAPQGISKIYIDNLHA